MRSWSTLLALLPVLAAASPVAEPEGQDLEARKPGAPQKFWFSFGDSYTQTWFNSTGEQPNSANPLGNPPFPGYTACGHVPSWVGYSIAKYNSSLVLAYNYAYGGAVIDSNLVTPWRPDVQSLIDQVNIFGNDTAPGKPFYPGWKSHNSIFAFWIGINDIGNSFWLEGDRDAFSDVLINRYFEQVAKVYATGARNFLFLSVPPIYISPLMLAQPQESRDAEKKVLEGFNKKLLAKTKWFEKKFKGSQVYFYDTDKLFLKMAANPAKYGLKDFTSYGPEDNVGWCNDYHISPAANDWIAKDVAKILRPRFI